MVGDYGESTARASYSAFAGSPKQDVEASLPSTIYLFRRCRSKLVPHNAAEIGGELRRSPFVFRCLIGSVREDRLWAKFRSFLRHDL